MAKLAKPMQPRDYFDSILRFNVSNKETAPETAMRLWNIIERIPRVEMPEEIRTGLVTTVLCYKDPLIRRELDCQTVTTRAQLCRVLTGITLKRRLEVSEMYDNDLKRFKGNDNRVFKGGCHRCGNPGHKQADCNRRRREDSEIERLSGNGATKEVHVCQQQHRCARSVLSTSSGETVSFLFDSGSACSLIKLSLAKKFSGTAQHDTIIYLTGVGCEKVLCDFQI